jgi:hypothetical protein
MPLCRPLPPASPIFRLEGILSDLHSAAIAAIGRLEIAGSMVSSPDWFLDGFVRKEAVRLLSDRRHTGHA